MRELSPAEQLLYSLGVSDPNEIDLEAIAYDQGAVVKYRVLDGCEARIVGKHKAIITVNLSRFPERRRFSIAHELGHWHHHRGKTFECRASDIQDGPSHSRQNQYEQQANRFASDLIMPAYLFRPRAHDCKNTTFENVKKLADAFKTSITATAIRMVELGPEPAMLLCHNQNGQKWVWPGPDIPKYWRFPNREIDADSSALDVLFGNIHQSRRTLTDGSVWYNHYDAERYEIFEQARQIVEGEILVLLAFKDAAMLKE